MSRTVHNSLGGSEVCSLFVHRAMMAPPSRPWRLLWATSADASTFVHAEGECSAVYYRTMKDAVMFGVYRFGETAARFKD